MNCQHPQHKPKGIYVGPGERYTHICPGCGNKSVVRQQPEFPDPTPKPKRSKYPS